MEIEQVRWAREVVVGGGGKMSERRFFIDRKPANAPLQ